MNYWCHPLTLQLFHSPEQMPGITRMSPACRHVGGARARWPRGTAEPCQASQLCTTGSQDRPQAEGFKCTSLHPQQVTAASWPAGTKSSGEPPVSYGGGRITATWKLHRDRAKKKAQRCLQMAVPQHYTTLQWPVGLREGNSSLCLLVSGQPAKQKAGRADQKLLKIMHQLTDTTVLGIY